MESISRSGRPVQGFALGDLGHGGGGGHGGGHGGGGFHGGGQRGYGGGLPGGWGWWGTPYVPDAAALPLGTCTAWGDPVVMPSGMAMAARAALGASGFQPTVAQGPDGVLYRFSVEGSAIVVRPCASQQVGTLGEVAGTGLAGTDKPALSPVLASLMTGATAGLLAHVLRAPLWGAILSGAGAALVTHVGIDRIA